MYLKFNLSETEIEILENLTVYDVSQKKIRLGHNKDGGYIIIEEQIYDLYLSCGVGDEVSFDCDFLETNKISTAFSYDGTCVPPTDFPQLIQHQNKNIGVINSDDTTNLIEETANFGNIFLKMDIEGHEWEWINHYPIERIKQFVIECHGFFDQYHPQSWAKTHNLDFNEINVLNALRKINKTHVLVHLHGNNGGHTRKIDGSLSKPAGNLDEEIFTVAELTFLRKDCCDSIRPNTHSLPIQNLDFRNFEQHCEILLDKEPFVNKNKNIV